MLLRTVVFAAMLAGFSSAQAPVPTGVAPPSPPPPQPKPVPAGVPMMTVAPGIGRTGALSGIVKDAHSRGIPNADVTLLDPISKRRIALKTGADGAFAFPEMGNGEYQLLYSGPDGITLEDRVAITGPTRYFIRGGPVPTGLLGSTAAIQPAASTLPPVPVPTGGAPREYQVEQKAIEGEDEVKQWLETFAGARLTAITPLEDNVSVFVFDKNQPAAHGYFVLPVTGAISRKALEQHVRDLAGKHFVGVHRVSAKAYYMVFVNE